MDESAAANRAWWDHDADEYHARHPEYLGAAAPHGEFYWCPEMLHESEAQLLGDVRGARVLELGCGSAPCARWLAANRAPRFVAGVDISRAMLAHAGGERVVEKPGLAQADASALPFRDSAFDVVYSVFGAIRFVADSAGLMREVARVLRPGGKFVFSIAHPMRWMFVDDPDSLDVYTSYFDRTGYVERDDHGRTTYAEHHRTMGDRFRELIGAGFVLDDLIEPEWPPELDQTWGQWSPQRGAYFPGTAIFSAHLG